MHTSLLRNEQHTEDGSDDVKDDQTSTWNRKEASNHAVHKIEYKLS